MITTSLSKRNCDGRAAAAAVEEEEEEEGDDALHFPSQFISKEQERATRGVTTTSIMRRASAHTYHHLACPTPSTSVLQGFDNCVII